MSHVADPGRVADLAETIRAGQETSVALVERYLERIGAVEPALQAWASVDHDGALAHAAACDVERADGRLRGPLHGVPVGIKDVIDVAGFPTRCYSKLRAGVPAAGADAPVVAALRQAGAVILGKTHTTEYAYFDPSPARNPHNPDHTPGGSSSGSAAAVAAGMVPATVGTQTVASVNRPAAYCGVAAFKPSTGSFGTFGIWPLAPMYDTPGFFGATVADAVAVFEAVCPAFLAAPAEVPWDDITVIALRDPWLDHADAEMAACLADVADRVAAAGVTVRSGDSPVSFATLFERQKLTFEYEMARVHRAVLDAPSDQVGGHLRATVARALETPDDGYRAARREIADARAALFAAFPDADAFVWPAAPGPAPEGLASTGDPKFISPWTALGGPLITVPVGTASNGLPLAVLLAAAPGGDRALGRTATRLAAALG